MDGIDRNRIRGMMTERKTHDHTVILGNRNRLHNYDDQQLPERQKTFPSWA